MNDEKGFAKTVGAWFTQWTGAFASLIVFLIVIAILYLDAFSGLATLLYICPFVLVILLIFIQIIRSQTRDRKDLESIDQERKGKWEEFWEEFDDK